MHASMVMYNYLYDRYQEVDVPLPLMILRLFGKAAW